MIYEYRCISCSHHFDVVKPVRDIDVNENCPKCDDFAERMFVPQKVHFTGTQVQHAEYNPAFGKVVKNKKDREELAKRKGMVEVGNDFKSSESMQKHFDKERAEKREKRWEED